MNFITDISQFYIDMSQKPYSTSFNVVAATEFNLRKEKTTQDLKYMYFTQGYPRAK